MTVIIAIDGPSASGKGTLSKSLAKILGFDYLDTGALYRVLGYHVLKAKIVPSEVDKILSLVPKIDFTEGKKLPISNEEVGKIASQIAGDPKIREALNAMQRSFPEGKQGVVIDGRDIGTLIFPHADCKFFITANLEIRAERRYKQLQNSGKNIIFDQVLKSLKERDERDRTRAIAPTLPANDALIIDTSDLNENEVLELVLKKTLETLKHSIININQY